MKTSTDSHDRELSPGTRILFVCTGNTCRSPLAEVLSRKILAQHLGCEPEKLAERGYSIESAGLAALPGQEATPEAVEVAREHGCDLTSHRSRPVTENLLARTDLVVGMTRSHLVALLDVFSETGVVPRLLLPGGYDLEDPIGCELEVYRECARTIVRALEAWLPEWHDPSRMPTCREEGRRGPS